MLGGHIPDSFWVVWEGPPYRPHSLGDGSKCRRGKGLKTICIAPTRTSAVRSFLALDGFYHRFMKDFSTIALPLHALSKKNAPFIWGPSQDTAFNEPKNLLTHALSDIGFRQNP